MRLTLIIISTIALCAMCLTAQPQIDQLRLYDSGGGSTDIFKDVYLTSESDYFVCGKLSGGPAIMRLDQQGNVLWEYSEDDNLLFSIIQADNGDAVSVGIIGNGMFGAVRIDPEGELVWRREYFRGRATAVIELKDGNFIICGRWGRVIKIDAEGEPLWERRYRAEDDHCYLHSMRETDGEVVLVGSMSDEGTHGWILKISSDDEGEVLWSRSYEIENQQTHLMFYSIVSTGFGFAIGGGHGSGEGGFALYFVNENGELIENYLYQNSAVFGSLNKLSDGGFVLVGYYGSPSDARQYPLAIRTDSDGNIVWTNNFSEIVDEQPRPDGQSRYNQLRGVIVQPNDVIVACGWMYNNEQRENGHDALLVRLEPDQPEPLIFHWSPEDTILTVLLNDTTTFIVRARDQQGDELSYAWFLDDNEMGEDTTITVNWEDIGEHIVQCRVSDGEWASSINWRVEVTRFYIDAYSPDSLDIVVRRNTSVDFEVSTRLIGGGFPDYEWRLDGEVLEDAFRDNMSILFEHGRNHEVEAWTYLGELSDSVIWQITMLDLIVDYWPRQFDLEVTADTIIEFMIEPFDPQDASLNILWTVNGDSIGNRTWAFIDFDSIGEQQVAVFVSDSVSSDSMSWTIQVNPNSVDHHDISLLPDIPTLYPPTPNPFNSQTTVRYVLPASGKVRLELFDINGRLTTTIIDQNQTAGWHDVVVDGSELVSGVYFIRMVTDNDAIVKKVVLIR